jgi:hypothetical protein
MRKKLAELRHDTEESVATLGGQGMGFPAAKTTVSTLLDWFRTPNAMKISLASRWLVFS